MRLKMSSLSHFILFQNETIEKIDTLQIYVMTQLTSWNSMWQETPMIAPPEPSPYKGVLKLECRRLNVSLPDGDVFFSYFYVFKTVASDVSSKLTDKNVP